MLQMEHAFLTTLVKRTTAVKDDPGLTHRRNNQK